MISKFPLAVITEGSCQTFKICFIKASFTQALPPATYSKLKTSLLTKTSPWFRHLSNHWIRSWPNLTTVLQNLLILLFLPFPLSSPLELTVFGKHWLSLRGKWQNSYMVLFIQLVITTLSQHSDALSWNVLIFSDDASSVFFIGDMGQSGVADVPICSPK